MQTNSRLPHMTYTDLRKKPDRAATPPESAAPPPADPPNGSTPTDHESPPSPPEQPTPESDPPEQAETDAAPAEHEDDLQHLQTSVQGQNESLATGKDKVENFPQTPAPNRGGEDKVENLSSDPLLEWSRQVGQMRMQEIADEPEEKTARRRRSPILDEVNRQLILKLIEAGMSRRRAAKHIGITHTTIANEAKRNQEFANDLREAEMRRELEPLSSIQHASRNSWKAAAWLLEHNQPEAYGKRIHTRPSPEELHKALSQFAQLIGQDLQLEPATRERLLNLADALSRQDLEEARVLLHTTTLHAPPAVPVVEATQQPTAQDHAA